MSDMRLAVAGAAGRMGRMLVSSIADAPGAVLAGALESKDSPALGQDAGLLAGRGPNGVLVSADADAVLRAADALIDFSCPSATVAFARLSAERGVAHVIGTTGLSADDLATIAEAAKKIAVVRSGNMSLGVNLLAVLAERAARALGPPWDAEILEMHHRMKVDAPSGTALLLGEAVARGRGVELSAKSVRSRDGLTGPRNQGDIGFATLRGGTVVGEHAVIFAGNGERIELVHRAEDRGVFARGAVEAALWAKGRAPGLFSMADVLGLGG